MTIQATELADKARTELRVAVGAVSEAMQAVAAAGLDPQVEIVGMMQEAFTAAGEEMPPMLRMLFG